MKIIAFWLCFIWAGVLFGEEPSALYLTWRGDPTTTMVVQWHSLARSGESRVWYREEQGEGWQRGDGVVMRLPEGRTVVHTVELSGLVPDTRYVFRIGDGAKEYLFRTCPRELGRPLRFAVGGDVYYYIYLLRKMNREIAKCDPDFVLVGGDIAYTHNHKTFFKGKNWEEKRWGTFFKEWKRQMVAPDGRLIPMVVIVGNHDVKARQPGNLFFSLFASPESARPYREIDFGDYLSLFCLDTGHMVPIEGEQRSWLKSSLAANNARWKMAIYHVAAYPSVYKYESAVPTKIREEWVPLFERHGIRLAFENHNHAYKRTHPLKGGKIDPEGVIYLGDGSWGVSPRKPQERWYLAKSSQINCFWMVTLGEEGCEVRAVGPGGKTIEEVRLPGNIAP